ncbi:MAG: trigger factor [Epsilonproteobacteria bacterium]|nr:trigger factor [Campylobacterota bacterium]
MNIKTERIDSANSSITATISKADIEQKETQLAQAAAKDMKIDGFRKGKVPTHVVKARYGAKLTEDAKNEALREVYEQGITELKLDQNMLIGEPSVKKFDESGDDIEAEITIATRPEITIEGYKELIPEIKKPKTTKKDVEERINEMLKSTAAFSKVEKKRALKSGDYALIDFEGFVDGEAFQGGTAKAYTLEVGSGSFIPGFEDQMIGMQPDEEKDVTVKFPEEYQSKELAGKDAVFKVTLIEIQEKVIPTDIDEETLKKLLPGEEAPTKETLETNVKEQLVTEKLGKLYQEETKPKFVEALVEKYEIDLPLNIVEQEMDMAFRNAFSTFEKEDIEKYSTDVEAAKEKREEYRSDASDSVKLTFIVDELAKKEEIAVDDQEVMQTIYFEALQSGQDPQAYIKQYEEQGLLPAVKMAIVEDKLFKKLFDEK